MSVKKRRFDDPSDTGKLDVYRDLEERVLSDAPDTSAGVHDAPGRTLIEAAIAERDTGLLRKIAAERKGLNDEQRRALLLLADLLERRKT
jgi:hypothetical protein